MLKSNCHLYVCIFGKDQFIMMNWKYVQNSHSPGPGHDKFSLGLVFAGRPAPYGRYLLEPSGSVSWAPSHTSGLVAGLEPKEKPWREEIWRWFTVHLVTLFLGNFVTLSYGPLHRNFVAGLLWELFTLFITVDLMADLRRRLVTRQRFLTQILPFWSWLHILFHILSRTQLNIPLYTQSYTGMGTILWEWYDRWKKFNTFSSYEVSYLVSQISSYEVTHSVL